jgi:penicillin-binding protein 1C
MRLHAALCAWACGLGAAAPVLAAALPSPQEVRASFQPSDTYILSREGEVLQRLRTDMQVRRGQWVALRDVSPALRLALLVSEDQRFYAHSGVDWRAASAAAWGNLWHTKTRGASTITMQLAGLLDEDWRASNSGRSVGQKMGQALAATQLERRWRKDQILEAYLNLLPFRGELVGIDALSRTLFGKAPHGLDDMESAIAAALVRGPNASPATVAQRACGVWQDVARQQAIASIQADCTALQWRVEQTLRARLWPASEGIAPHWAQRVWGARDVTVEIPKQGLSTTISAGTQRLAVESLQRHLRELQGRGVEDGAAVVLDNRSGQVLAWVGSSGSLSQAREVDGVLAWRQPGSTLKPFLYAQAFDEKRLTAASLLEDSSAQIATPSGLYIPQNYDRRFKGWVSARMALAGSLNVPAVRTLVMVTPDAFFAQLRQLGLPLRENAGYHGYSLALGSAEVPLLHLTNAYRALANGGRFTPVASAQLPVRSAAAPVAQHAANAVQAVSPQAAFVVADILSDAQSRATTFGLDSVLATRFWTAVKTGTSKDMRDNWALGWSGRYTVGVWVGNASGAAMHNVSGSSGAAPIWADIMVGLHARTPSRAPEAPSGMAHSRVEFVPADNAHPLEPSRKEWFIAGTQQPQFQQPAALSSEPAQAQAKITSPTAGTLLALDPDIPPSQQLLQLRANHVAVRWIMDGQPLGVGQQLPWQPWPGPHVLQIQNARGQVLDEVRFEVRGAVAKPSIKGHARGR